ncbi:MAG: hypothetical protein J6U14_07180 [Bacteroidaceae bacterium]|nr:hypothetical protein [Bacteroidaceae bacterium]
MDNMVPINECIAINLKGIEESKSIVALHETGHLIVMYAFDLMEYFNGITIISGNGTLGLTDMVPNFANEMDEYANSIDRLEGNLQQSGEELDAFISAQYLQGLKLYLPHICRLFAGGSITRYYEISAEELCQIDRENIIRILRQYQLDNQIEIIQNLIDLLLKNVFLFYDTLIKTIYMNLLKHKTLSVDDINCIISEWKRSRPFPD